MHRISEVKAALTEARKRFAELRDELDGLEGDDVETRADELLAQSDETLTEITQLEKRLAQLERITAAVAANPDVSDDPLGEPAGDVRTDNRIWDLDSLRHAKDGELRARALAATEKTPGMQDRQRQYVTEMVEQFDQDDSPGADRVYRQIIVTSNRDYMKAWTRAAKAVIAGRNPNPADQTILDRAMSLTDASGGYLVPLPVDPTLNITGDGSANPFRQISRVVPITTDVLRTVNAGATSFSWDGEAAEVSDDASTFANIDITAHKAQGFVPFSIEAGQDIPDFTAQVGRLFARGRDDLEATAFATGLGDGSNQPVGIVTALTGGSSVYTQAGATDTFTIADVYGAEDNLGHAWLPNAVWVANKAIYNDIRQFDTSGGNALWERIGAGQPPELLGYPAYRASGMDGTVTALADNYILILGDFDNYVIANRVGFSVELIPHLFATANNLPSGQRGLYAYWRVGADSVNDSAFAMLNVT